MARNLSAPLNRIVFRCDPCQRNFETEPARVEDDPSAPWHPFAYSAPCPSCGDDAAQAQYHRALIKAWASATGPRTPEGKATVARNLEGHPTPEETLRTRFNALKHGMHAEVAQYFPAAPGRYPACQACDVDPVFCVRQPACVKQTQLFMLHHAAFEQRDPKHLTTIYASIQSAITAVVQQILQTIIADGVKLETPAWAVNRDGDVVIGEYTDIEGQTHTIIETRAHPLLDALSKFLARNNLSLSDMGMTPKVIEQEEEQLGRLQHDAQSQLLLADFAQRQQASLEALKDLAKRAQLRKEADPVLIEYRQQNGGDDEVDGA